VVSFPQVSPPKPCTRLTFPHSHLLLGLPSGLFPSGFPTKTLYTPHLSHLLLGVPKWSLSFRFPHQNPV
jgi:hypothetical protein